MVQMEDKDSLLGSHGRHLNTRAALVGTKQVEKNKFPESVLVIGPPSTPRTTPSSSFLVPPPMASRGSSVTKVGIQSISSVDRHGCI